MLSIDFYFNIISPYGVFLCFCQKSFCFSLEMYLFLAMSTSSCVQSCLFVVWKYPYSYFSSHFCFRIYIVFSICIYVATAAIGYCNLSFFSFFNVVFESSWCIDAIFNAGECSTSLFSKHIQSVSVISRTYGFVHCYQFSCPLVHLSKSLLCPL